MISLKDKNIIVTGGYGLIGQEIVNDLENKGANPIILDINDKSINNKRSYYCDITNYKSVQTVIKQIINKEKHLHGLVNSAYPRTKDWGLPFEEIPIESWQKNVDMQMNSYFFLLQEVIKHMKQNKKGAIVNITSIYGVVGNDFTIYEGLNMNPPAAYSAIKGGIINLTRYLASLYGKDNIRLNCISPGGILDNQNPEFVKRYEEKVPMKRMGNPNDIAPAVSFLLSEEAKYITGQNLIIDGGWTAI